MSDKELVIEAVRGLPEGASLRDILEHLAIMAAIRQGEEDARAGRVISHEEMKRRAAPTTRSEFSSFSPGS